jgi:hypothetical protein
LRAGSFIAITLTWDREILFSNEGGDPDRFEVDDVFSPFSPLTDMDLYLLPIGANATNFRAVGSIASGTSVEHIFFQIPETQQYKI